MYRTWGDETVVYDPLSGNTHLIDPVAAAVLDHLARSSGSVTALAGLLLGEFDADCEADVLAAVHAALAKLRDIGLVRSTTE
jgi:PqqD family protein of HPr-rel-A system